MQLALDRDALIDAASAEAKQAVQAVSAFRDHALPPPGWAAAGASAARVVGEGESVGSWAVGSAEAWRRCHEEEGGGAPRPMRVCLRKRPLSEAEAAALGTADDRCEKCFDALSVSSPGAWFHEWQDSNDVMTVKRLAERGGLLTRCYGPFDHAFDGGDDTDSVYEAVRDLVPFVLGGGTATCIAYGQTGAGKTFTMTGLQDRLARDVFAAASGRPIRLAFLENQGERCFDLQNERAKLSLREDADGAVHVAGLTEITVSTLEALREALAAANQLRATAPTQTHPHSSRSHAILSLRVEGADGSGGGGGLLRVVDLAGSERHESASAHSMERIAEMRDINSSLSSLKDCIRAQRDAPASAAGGLAVHIPYRRSKLTMLLKECFTAPEARTVFVAHVAPLAACTQYTKSTLDYCTQLLAVAERRAKQQQQQRGSGSSGGKLGGGRTDPSKWSRARVRKWLESVDGGRFAFAADDIPLDGMSMRHTPTSGEFGFDTRLGLAGVSDEDKLAEGQRLGDLFAKELRDYAEAKREAAAAAAAGSSADGAPSPLPSSPPPQPVSATVMGELMRYYGRHNPKFANPMKITRICRSFQAKARTAAAAAAAAAAAGADAGASTEQEGQQGKGNDSNAVVATAGAVASEAAASTQAQQQKGKGEEQAAAEEEEEEGGAWVEMLYAALAEKTGGIGPRDVPPSAGSAAAAAASCGYVPVETTTATATAPLQEIKQQQQQQQPAASTSVHT